MIRIFIDADGCAVKDETYKVADRYRLKVIVVANKPLTIPSQNQIEMKVVSDAFDAADDWIVESAGPGDIVITSDILLAERCVKNLVRVIGPKGLEWTEDNIGSSVANRALMENLRQRGEVRGGPSPMEKQDRSNFLGTLDRVIQSLKREQLAEIHKLARTLHLINDEGLKKSPQVKSYWFQGTELYFDIFVDVNEVTSEIDWIQFSLRGQYLDWHRGRGVTTGRTTELESKPHDSNPRSMALIPDRVIDHDWLNAVGSILSARADLPLLVKAAMDLKGT